MWSSGGGSGRVSDPTDTGDVRSLPLKTPREYSDSSGSHVDRTWGDLLDHLQKNAANDPSWSDNYNAPYWDKAPPGYKWIREIAVHQSYPWFWNLARDSSGSFVSVSGGRDVTDTFRDRWRRRHAGYSRSFFRR